MKKMPGIKAKGIVLRETEFGESNRMLTVFTKEYGIIRVAVYGAKSIKSGKGAACQIFSYSEYELKKGAKDIYTVSAVSPIESFFGLSEDIVKFSLSAYFAELILSTVGESNPDETILKLYLNTLYALCYNGLEVKKAKCVFEMRLMSLLGYRPQLTKCVRCDNIKEIVAFSATDGGLLCKNCRVGGIDIGKATCDALYYIITAEDKKIFSFTVSDEVLKKIGKISEEYTRVQIEGELKSLLYLKKMMI